MSKFKKGDKVTFVSSNGFPLLGAFEGKGGTIQSKTKGGYYVKNDPGINWAVDVTYWTEAGLKLAGTVDNGPLKVGDTVKFASVSSNDVWLEPFYGKTGTITEITNAYNVKVTHGDGINWGSDYTYWQHSQLEKVNAEAIPEKPKPKPTFSPGMLVKFTGVEKRLPKYGIIQTLSATTPDVWLVNHRHTYSTQTWWEETNLEPVTWNDYLITTSYRVGEKVTLKDNAPWFPSGECVIYDVSYGMATLDRVLFKLRPIEAHAFTDADLELGLDEFKKLEWNPIWFVKKKASENIKSFVDAICDDDGVKLGTIVSDEPNTMVIPTPGKTPMQKKQFVALAEVINGLGCPTKTKKALCDALSPVLAQTNSNYDPYVFYEAACE